ncbi:MAG: hypothetical protein JNK82_41955 [Myxococcaceae bacterium]|nr:hypothetical protein [Myxococcaceae bacterium]
MNDWLPGALCAGLVLAAGLGLVAFNLRRVATRKKAGRLPPDVVAQARTLIDAAGTVPVLLRPAASGTSWLGGLPRLRQWPEEGAVHLGEVDGVSVFYAEDHVLAVRAEDVPPLPAPPAVQVLTKRLLSPLKLPGTWEPRGLLANVKGLAALLEGHGDAPERLLPYVLMPGLLTHELSTEMLVLKGGEPELIQNEHPALCPECQAKQTFSFSVGDVFEPELTLGDGAVVYVYTCPAHPLRPSAFIDSH